MRLRSLLNSLKARPVAPVRRSTPRLPVPRLRVESLEDRSLPSGTVSLAPNEPPAPQLVGEAVTWTATAAGVGPAPVYQFSVAPHDGDPSAHSRGQVWALDEQTMTATLVVNADLGSYPGALGAAERLSNGDYSFTLGTNGSEPIRPPAHTVEVTPDGTRVYDLAANAPEYRTFRVRTLYEGVDDALAGVPTTVASVVLNDGSAQRSMIDSITVTFSGAVVLDPAAVELRRQDGTLVDARVSISLVDGKTVAVLTFAGPEFVSGSPADGRYALTVRADRVHDRWGRELDGDADGSAGGDRVDGFFRLFGDSDGDGDVDERDRDAFRSAFGKTAADAGYLWYFDFDGDGDVDGRDNRQFNRRFGRS